MSYKELNQRSNSVALELCNQGIQPGNRVGIMIDKSFELVIAILGVLKCGACYVPVDNNYNLDRKNTYWNNHNPNYVYVIQLKISICLKSI